MIFRILLSKGDCVEQRNIIFFSRDYQSQLFPLLTFNKYQSLHVTLTKREKSNVLKLGGQVVGCLEEDFHNLEEAQINFPYLHFSWGADRFLRNYSYHDRLGIQKKVASFWSNIFERYSPIAVVNEPVVIEVSEIMWIEAKKRGIRYLAMAYFNKPNSFYWLPYPEKCTLKGYIEKKEITEKNIQDAIKYISAVKSGLKPNYISNLPSRYSLSKLYELLKRITASALFRIKHSNKIVRELCYGDSLELYVWQLKLYFKAFINNGRYDNCDNLIDGVDYLFFPLHYEPEGVLFYGAYFFDDQNELIKNILKCIGENRILIVKEHPQQPGLLLQKKYLELKERYPNLMFCKAEESSLKIIRKSALMLTLGGTSGFEALVLGKPVINFGSVFYDAFEGVINIKCFDDLYKLLRENTTFVMKGDLISYTAKLLGILCRGNPHPGPDLYKKTNVEAIINAIEVEIA